MKITLNIQDQDKTFTVPFVSGRALRKTIEITKKTNFNDVDVDTLDTLVDYVVDIFKGQFTRDEFYDGVEANQLLNTIVGCINEIVGKTQKATSELSDPNDQ